MKKDPTAWLSAARRELEDLLTTGGVALTDADAWRALALTARLAFGLDGASARSASDRALVEVRLGACAEPNPGELCDALDDALVGDDPPEASLLDCLLDIDDLAGVLCLRGAEGAATELIDDACATLSVQPERLAPLADFARMRLATLGPSTPVGVLWARVEGALIEAAVATQPIATAPSVEAIAVRERIARASSAVVELATRRRLLLPAPVALAAASNAREARALGVTADGIEGWIDEEAGTARIELTLPDGSKAVRGLTLVASTRGTDLVRVSIPTRREGRCIFASLGPVVGTENLQRATSARLGRDVSAVEWWIEVEDGD